MKKTVVFLVCLLLTGMSLYAEFGVKFGGGLGTFKDMYIPGEEKKMMFSLQGDAGTRLAMAPDSGFSAVPDTYIKNQFHMIGGFYYTIPVSTLFVLQTELLYAQRGVRIEWDQKDYNAAVLSDRDVFEGDLTASYLELPLLLKTTFPGTPVSIVAGPSIALNIASNWNYTVTDYDYDLSGNETEKTIDDTYDGEIDDCMQSIVVNLHIGFEYALSDTLFAEVRYVMGLTSVEKPYGMTEAKYDSFPTEEEYIDFLHSHPFIYDSERDPEGEDDASIETSDLYIMIGYRF